MIQGEKNLQLLLQSMRPQLNEGRYVFCTVPAWPDIAVAAVLFHFNEAEGITLVLPKAAADAMQLNYSFVAAWITLTVHSSLEAVGLTAAFAAALTREGISCNVVAGFYHDHIFVPEEKAAAAMQALETLAAGSA
jgi:hypothetical protein